MALSLEQDGQELVDDTDSAPSRGGGGRFLFCSGCVNSVTFSRLASYLLAEVVYLLTRAEGDCHV